VIEQLPSLVSAVVSDGFTYFSLQGGAAGGLAAGVVLRQLMCRRLERARDILLEELSLGEKRLPPTQIDEAVAITYRYFRAAQEGTARLNLRLLASVIAGQARLSALVADEFLRDADMIASLRREEVMLLAKLHHAWGSDWLQQSSPPNRSEEGIRWATAQLVPSVFEDRQSLEATAGALVRTGLLKMVPGVMGLCFSPTPLLARLVSLAPLEAAIAKETRAT
jgi:hypothetical protein